MTLTKEIPMWIHTFFKSLTSTSTRRRPIRRLASRLCLEALEDRCTPSAVLAISDVAVLEGSVGAHNAVVTVTVTVSAPHGNSITMNYNTADGTAKAGSDYNSVSGKLTFAKNEMSKNILVPLIGDRIPEADESFFVRLSNAKGANIAKGEGIVTIVDDEPRISNNNASLLEGNSGSAPMTFTVSLSVAYDLPVTVNYTTTDGSAIAGIDYTAASGTLTFAPGQTSQTITVGVIGDRLAEPDETFFVNVSTPNSYAAISQGAGVGTIIDGNPHIRISDASQADGGTSPFTFYVSLPTAWDEVVTVNFATVDGTAIAGRDYGGGSGTLTFAPGETIKTITVLAWPSAPDLYFYIHLSGASTNALISNEWAYGSWYYDTSNSDPTSTY